jgi:hypothetical protein
MVEEMGATTAAVARQIVTQDYPAIVATTARLRDLFGDDYDRVRAEVEKVTQ